MRTGSELLKGDVDMVGSGYVVVWCGQSVFGSKPMQVRSQIRYRLGVEGDGRVPKS